MYEAFSLSKQSDSSIIPFYGWKELKCPENSLTQKAKTKFDQQMRVLFLLTGLK